MQSTVPIPWLAQLSWLFKPGIAAAAVLVGLVTGASVANPLPLAVAGMGALLVLPVVARILAGRTIDPLEPLWPFVTCYFIAYGMKPLIDAAGGTTFGWFQFELSSALLTVLIASALLLFIYLAYFSGAYQTIVRLLPTVAADPSPWRIRAAVLLLTACGLVSLLFHIRMIGPEFSLLAATRGAYRVVTVSAAYGRGYLLVLPTLASFAPALQFALALRTRSVLDGGLVLLVFSVVGPLLVVLYSRQLILQTLVMLVVVAYFRGRWLKPSMVAALGVAILVAGGYLGLRTRAANVSALGAVAFLGHTFDSFEFVGGAIERLSPFGHFLGRTFFEDAAYTFLPRALFPDKPNVFGIVSIQYYVAPDLASIDVSTATYPPGFLVEGYANFGVLGIALIGLAYGLALRVAREWFWPRQDRVFAMLLYGGFVLNMTGLFRSAGQMAFQTLVYGTLLYLLLYGRIPVGGRSARR